MEFVINLVAKGKKLKKKGFDQLLMDAGKQPFDQRSNFIKVL